MTSMNAREYLEPVPTDILIEILSRLPVKSIARCRCVSKPWASMLNLLYFTELFLTRSRARPQLLFVCQNHDDELLFYSAAQPQNLDENSSSSAVVNHHMKLNSRPSHSIYRHPISSFVCIRDYMMLPTTSEVRLRLFNPSTGQSFTLPKTVTRLINCFLGYDPVGKQFKVLSTSFNQVLTLGTQKPSWRMIECCIPHFPVSHVEHNICIDGVLYYRALVDRDYMIACFDLRTEKYSFVKVKEAFINAVDVHATLINYKGKLGSLTSQISDLITATTRSFEICVLEDPENHEWSKHVYELPLLWKNVVGNTLLRFAGVAGANEVVFSPEVVPSGPLYVYYYNLESKTMRRVEIQGMAASMNKRIHTFLNYVENVKLEQDFS